MNIYINLILSAGHFQPRTYPANVHIKTVYYLSVLTQFSAQEMSPRLD